MHDLNDPANVLSREVVESCDHLGKECISCHKVLAYNFFKRDASFRDGRRDQCQGCEAAPRLSTAEHTARLREMNYYSHAVKKQRWDHQEEYQNTFARFGTPMHHSDLLRRIKKLVPSLYVVDGRIVGDLALYRTYDQPQPDLEGRTFRYLFYIPTGLLPEFSIYEFDERDIPVRETLRGWRTVLLRLIKSGLLTEAASDLEFGKATGEASTVWYRQLFEYRNRK
jgi:hypothetical protein